MEFWRGTGTKDRADHIVACRIAASAAGLHSSCLVATLINTARVRSFPTFFKHKATSDVDESFLNLRLKACGSLYMNADGLFWLRHSLSTPDMLLHVHKPLVIASSEISNYNRWSRGSWRYKSARCGRSNSTLSAPYWRTSRRFKMNGAS